MRIVICDDDRTELTKLEGLLEKYRVLRPDIPFEIQQFTDGALLLRKIQREEPADLYILDIMMTQITGIDLGNEIRRKSSRSIIIYATVSEGFALDAYRVQAVRYLLKPLGEKELFEALGYALSLLERPKESLYLVKTKNGLVSIPHLQIEYIENASRKQQIHLVNGEKVTSLFIRKSFEEETRELLGESSFMCVHKSFLINFNHVRKLNHNHITMDSGIQIPVSRNRALNVKKEYLLFVSAQCR